LIRSVEAAISAGAPGVRFYAQQQGRPGDAPDAAASDGHGPPVRYGSPPQDRPPPGL